MKKLIAVTILSIALAACGATTSAQQSPIPAQTSELSREEAIQLAISHLSSLGITDFSLEYARIDRENGRQVWDIEFSGNGQDLEFYVDIETGEFLKAPSATVEATPNVDKDATESVSKEEALALAEAHLERLGITNTRLDYANLKTENGRQVWDIEFSGNGQDLEFYVDIETGEFLKAPGSASSSSTPAPIRSASGEVSRDEAAEIALAVVPNGTLIEVDRDRERGRDVWYVAIRVGNRVHEVYVDMGNGEIVLHESYED